MKNLDTKVDVHQDHEFDVTIAELEGRYIYFLDIHQKNGEKIELRSEGDTFGSEDEARQAARYKAWTIIEEIVKSSP